MRYFRAKGFSGEVLHQTCESPWALTPTEPVSEEFEFLPADWPEKHFSAQYINEEDQQSDSGLLI